MPARYPWDGEYQIALQTNLYSVSDDKLALMLEHGVSMSFSYDVIPGVRLNLLGKPTESVVLKNIQRLRAMGIQMNGIAVLAKHTVDRITDVYDFYAAQKMGMRILPLFDGPDERPAEQFMVDHPSMIAALERLFRHWMESGCKTFIRPFDLYLQATLRHMAGLRVGKFNRSAHGDGVLLVNVDGSVYRVTDAYVPELSLGSLAEQSVNDLLQSDSYAASLSRDGNEYDAHCKDCSYRAACNGGFIHDTRATFPYEGACVTAWHCIDFMSRYIREQGYDDADIRGLLTSIPNDGQTASRTLNL
jgi:radical SAM protein with 4Fe4S-binding SPASM domain